MNDEKLAPGQNIPQGFKVELRNAIPASIKIRAAQVKPAHPTTQLAPDLLQLRRTVRTKPLRMPPPIVRRLPIYRLTSRNRPRLIQCHPRNIPAPATAAQVDTSLPPCNPVPPVLKILIFPPKTKALQAKRRPKGFSRNRLNSTLYCTTTSTSCTPGCSKSISTYSPLM
jgi:hypothetical protein